jgi:tripartite-type tricarboxylate transporter receptor subunit TctC
MRTHQRNAAILTGVLGIFLMGAMAAAWAQDYPTRPVRLIVPSAPGGGTDTSARMITPKLSEHLGQQVVVENRAGAAAMIGTEAGARANPDGYTLLIAQSTMTIVPSTYRKVPFDPVGDFAPISLVVVVPQVLVGHPSLPPKTLKELIAFSKARPGELDYAAGGYGGNPHMSMALFLSMSGVDMTYIPYKSGNAGLVDALSGRVPLMMGNILAVLPHIRNGRLHAYGVTSAKRAPGAPDLPTLAEGGVPGYHAVQWFGILAPAGTPQPIVARLHRDLLRVMQDKQLRARFEADGAEATWSNTPGEFAALIRDEVKKWAKVAKAANIKPQ